MLKFTAIIILSILGFAIRSNAQLLVSPATNQGCQGGYITLDPIVISEQQLTDFNVSGSPSTLVFNLSGGGTLNNTFTGSISYLTGTGSVDAQISVINGSFTVTLQELSPGHETHNDDVLTISGLQINISNANPEYIEFDLGSSTLSVNMSDQTVVANYQGFAQPFGAGGTPEICSGAQFNFDGAVAVFSSSGVSATVSWSSVMDPAVSGSVGSGSGAISETLTNSTLSPANVVYTFSPTSTNGCTGPTFQVTLAVNPNPIADAGVASDQCDQDVQLDAMPSIGTGEWTQVGGGGTATFSPNSFDENAVATVDLYDTYTFRWTETSGSCVSFDDVAVTFTEMPVASAGGPASECDLDTNLAATPTVGSGTWTLQAGPGLETIGNPSDPNAYLTVTLPGAYTFRWTETNGACSSFDEHIVIFETQPVANAGSGGNTCGLSYPLDATPSIGVGTWSYTGPGSVFFSPNANDPDALATASIDGTYTITWTEVNGSCSDFADIIVDFLPQPVADAGTGGSVCDDDFTLNAVPSSGTGTWTKFSGPGGYSFIDENSATTSVNVLVYGTYTFRWQEVDGLCASFDDVTITFEEPPTINAGTDFTGCGQIFMTGTVGGAPYGTWSTVTDGTFITPNSPASEYAPGPNDISNGTVTLTFTTGGQLVCSPINDNVIVTIADPPTADAGQPTANICEDGVLGLSGAIGGSATSLTWSTDGSGAFNDPNDPNAMYTPDAGDILDGEVVLTITTDDPDGAGPCIAVSDMITLTIDALPTVNAGSDFCAPGVAGVSGSASKGISTSTWSTSGDGTFDDNTIQNTNYNPGGSDIALGFVTLTFTVDPVGVCTSAFDDVLLTISPGPTANAGTDDIICEGSNVALSAGFTVASGGLWTTNGDGSFLDQSDPSTQYIPGTNDVLNGGAKLTFTTTGNGACSPANDDVDVFIDLNPVPQAGPATNQCDLNFILDATPSAGAVGTWTKITGPGNISFNTTANDPDAQLSVDTYGSYQIRWTEVSGVCPPANDDLFITFFDPPTASAGPDFSSCDNIPLTLSASFGGSAPGGTWSGTGAFNNPALTNATYTPSSADLVNGTATLTFQTNAHFCGTVSDQVTVTLDDRALVSTGPNTSVSAGDDAIISAASSTFQGSLFPATWSTSGDGIFANELALSTTYTPGMNDVANGVVTLTLTSADPPGACSSTLSQMLVMITPSDNEPTVFTADSVALASLYNATDGPNWTINTNWNTGDVNSWYGVVVVNKRVAELHLNSNGLTGIIPASIAALTGLTSVDLSDNDLQGSLPSQIGSLQALEDLALNNNRLSGSIPTEIGTLANLLVLDLSNNEFTGALPLMPAQLTQLDASNNQLTALTSIPANLQSIDLSVNQLVTLGDLSGQSLAALKVEQNKLTFEDLEPNIAIPNFTYSPQDSLDVKLSLLLDVGATAALKANLGGTQDMYQWFKNGAQINGATGNSLTISNISTADDAVYHYRVTNGIVPGLTLHRRPIELKVSSLRRDSISLRLFYDKTGGPNWTNKTNWITTPLATGNWQGVTIANNRVTAVSLPGNNITGPVPQLFADIAHLTVVNLANNKINFIPDLSQLNDLTTVNVSNNMLHFNSLETNAAISGINYSNQATIGESTTELIEAGDSYLLEEEVGGEQNVYKWKLNNQPVLYGDSPQLEIDSISRSTMGLYQLEITNPLVPNLTLKTAVDTLLAISNLSGRLFVSETQVATKGSVKLLKVTSEGGYETTGNVSIATNGAFLFPGVVLADYTLVALADTNTYDRALPTYYKKTIFWEEADTISVLLRNTPGLDIRSEFIPVDVPTGGHGVISGYVEEDVTEGTGGRTELPKKVANAGVNARRVQRGGRGKDEAEILTLVGYTFTDENGEFKFTNLLTGEYRLNIQYPGFPMDENSFITIPVGDNLDSEKRVEAIVAEGKIHVRELVITHIWSLENYKVDLYPNPAPAEIQIKFQWPSNSRTAALHDVSGREVMSTYANETEQSIDISALPAGNYILNISDRGMLVKTVHVVIE
jgi:Leucine-rich repeat (LRR) protein